jgi:hypothetical protein
MIGGPTSSLAELAHRHCGISIRLMSQMGQERHFRDVREESGLPDTWHIAASQRTAASCPILLQKYFEHFVAQHWFKIGRERATTIQRSLCVDSIVTNFYFTESAWRLLQHNLP